MVIAPIDLGVRDRADALAAAVVAREFGTQLELVHVVEPISNPPWLEVDAERRNLQRQRRAVARLTQLQDELERCRDSCARRNRKAGGRDRGDRVEQARRASSS